MDPQGQLARVRLEQIEAEWRRAKRDGTTTRELKTRLADARRWYRERWRPVDPNGVQPGVVEGFSGVSSPGE